ncbi:uncharacterized protein LOC126785021 isoform X3 [Argentina anserina]|uniref:uncharacterized protein LOC126785021 isoform X3 n=1 Tax=Argentina anserina TaxID=57926 RepID=UPI0021767A2F|nr:uncharacterized protein LOC126785021 isoform X3 [Potentilla anserina]
MASSASLSMPSSLSLQPPRCSSHRHQVGISFSLLKNSEDVVVSGMWRPRLLRSAYLIDCKKSRRTLICAVNQDAEEAFKKTVEVDRLIDKLRDANPIELQKLVVENVLAFNEGFWIRLAARTDTCKSEDDKKDYEELAISVMSIVDRLVHKTNEKINSATDVLKGILKPVVDDVVEIQWPPRDPESLKLMEKAKEDGDKPGLEAMLQKVLQLYASKVLSKRSYAKKGDEILKAEEFLETIIKAPEEEWNKLLLNGLSIGKGDIPPPDLYAVIKKRIERTLIRTEGGSYQQRVLSEYLNGIQSRAEQVVQVLEGKPQ